MDLVLLRSNLQVLPHYIYIYITSRAVRGGRIVLDEHVWYVD